MRLSNLIKELEKKLEKHGDILCFANAPDHPFPSLLDYDDIYVNTPLSILEDAGCSEEVICHIGGFSET